MRRLLQAFFYLLYHPLAWTYDLVAWLVSLGHWSEWIGVVLPHLRGPRVLELGHGPGHLLVAMRSSQIKLYGLDLSRPMGHLARRRNPDAALVRADGRHSPFAAGSFDQLVATFPTEYILHPDTLAGIRRVLASGGQLLIVPVAWLRGRNPLSRAAAWLFRVTGQAGNWDGRFSTAIAAAGFALEEQRVDLGHSEVMLLVATKSPA
jgi:ubiquinone/menaquinone biosynthesis C-methylase UbiE